MPLSSESNKLSEHKSQEFDLSNKENYVGPLSNFDIMGASQFRLLCTLGLRRHHRILDFGCGSLRLGRLLIPYLNPGNYYGIEPNHWLIEEAVQDDFGKEFMTIRKPTFDHNSNFDIPFDTEFDFTIAQSIFSHTGQELVEKGLRSIASALHPDGIAVATFIIGKSDQPGCGWYYPECVEFRSKTIKRIGLECGLSSVRLPWFHPGQTWFLFSKNSDRIPSSFMRLYLRGAILFEPTLNQSWSPLHMIKRYYWKLRRS